MHLPAVEEFNLYFNAKVAKSIAAVVIICFICYHGFLHAVVGGDSCHRLLSNGRFQGSLVWQPYGCMLHTYSQMDSRRCMRYTAFLKQKNHFIFFGDSRIRQLYQAMVNQISINPPVEPQKAHQDLFYNETNLFLNIDYFWQPTMNKRVYTYFNSLKYNRTLPELIVLGCGTHIIKEFNGSSTGLEEFKHNLTVLSKVLNNLGNQTRVLWMLQDPVVSEKLSPLRSAITNEQIDLYNKASMEILYDTKVKVWSSSRLVAQGSLGGFKDGIHAGSVTIGYDVQILMNLYCNDHLNFDDGSCCSSHEGFTMTQIATFVALCSCSVVMIALALKQWVCATKNYHVCHASHSLQDSPIHNSIESRHLINQSSESNKENVKEASKQEVFMALGKLGLIMGYIFLCDSQLNFWLPLGYVFALGLFFTEDTCQTRLLHRDMTDEWKGWMQLVILIYHMTGASQILPIYMHVRVLVSAYVFLTGFGHFSYCWSGRDIGIVRYCQVMFRLNFLTVLLCLVMNRPYQFYYFVPLISFWYTVLHITLVLPPRISKLPHSNSEASPLNYFYSIIKFICLGGVITVLYLSEVFFEKVFVMRPWKALFVTTDDDIHEWWFRWQLDRYSLLYGMIFALLYSGLTQYNFIDDKSGSNNLLGGRLAFVVFFLASLLILSYTTMSIMCGNKTDCNEVHPYFVWAPMLGYIVLRNVIGPLRTRYSSFFAWFGRISLELFVCQYHIWLAADTHGVLVLIPSYPVANVLLTSFIFLCLSHEIHNITNIIAPVLVPSEPVKAIRNLGVFIALLFAIAIHDGVF